MSDIYDQTNKTSWISYDQQIVHDSPMTMVYLPINAQQEFDLKKFNADFEVSKQEEKILEERIDNLKLDRFDNNVPKPRTLSDYTSGDIMDGMKKSWITAVTNPSGLAEEHGFFFIGVTILILGLIMLLLNCFGGTDQSNTSSTGKQVIEIKVGTECMYCGGKGY